MAVPTLTFIVDDSNSQIDYVGKGWFEVGPSLVTVGSYGLPYNGTSKATAQSGSILFPFTGTSITAFGTTGYFSINTTLKSSSHQSFDCFVDGNIIGPMSLSPSSENNQVLCTQDKLSEGAHHFEINITAALENGFVLDYLAIQSPSHTQPVGDYVVRIDSDDASITYDRNWGNLAGDGSSTTVKGSHVTIDFTGTTLTWYGSLTANASRAPSLSSYIIDGGPPVYFNIGGSHSIESSTLFNQIYFTTSEIPLGAHSLVVTYEDTNTTNTPLVLDYIYINPTSLSVLPEHQTESSASASPTPSSGSDISLGSNHAGVIAGSVISGVVAILLALAILLLIRRCRNTHPDDTLPQPQPKISAPIKGSRAQLMSDSPSPPLERPANGRFRSLRPESSSYTEVSGYNEATIEQTRAIRKEKEAALELKRVALRNGLADTLPAYMKGSD